MSLHSGLQTLEGIGRLGITAEAATSLQQALDRGADDSELARRIGAFLPARDRGEASISEVHHVKKLDSPSGTALSLKKALGFDVPINSFREGDVIGVHSLELRLPGEIISLSHEATDRRVFAEGALWAAEQILERSPGPGVHLFENLVRETCFERTTP